MSGPRDVGDADGPPRRARTPRHAAASGAGRRRTITFGLQPPAAAARGHRGELDRRARRVVRVRGRTRTRRAAVRRAHGERLPTRDPPTTTIFTTWRSKSWSAEGGRRSSELSQLSHSPIVSGARAAPRGRTEARRRAWVTVDPVCRRRRRSAAPPGTSFAPRARRRGLARARAARGAAPSATAASRSDAVEVRRGAPEQREVRGAPRLRGQRSRRTGGGRGLHVAPFLCGFVHQPLDPNALFLFKAALSIAGFAMTISAAKTPTRAREDRSHCVAPSCATAQSRYAAKHFRDGVLLQIGSAIAAALPGSPSSLHAGLTPGRPEAGSTPKRGRRGTSRRRRRAEKAVIGHHESTTTPFPITGSRPLDHTTPGACALAPGATAYTSSQ